MPLPCRPSDIKAPFLKNSAAQDLEVVKSDIRELHTRANELRVAIGQAAATDVEQVLGRYSASSSSGDAASQALNKLRDQKAGELQILTLYECGRSVREARAVALLGKDPPEASTRRFNLRALLATVEAVSEQHRLLQEAERKQEAVQSEKAALQAEIVWLKEDSELFRTALLTKARPASAAATRPAPPPPRRPQSAPHRPAVAAAAGTPAAPPTPTTQTVVPAAHARPQTAPQVAAVAHRSAPLLNRQSAPEVWSVEKEKEKEAREAHRPAPRLADKRGLTVAQEAAGRVSEGAAAAVAETELTRLRLEVIALRNRCSELDSARLAWQQQATRPRTPPPLAAAAPPSPGSPTAPSVKEAKEARGGAEAREAEVRQLRLGWTQATAEAEAQRARADKAVARVGALEKELAAAKTEAKMRATSAAKGEVSAAEQVKRARADGALARDETKAARAEVVALKAAAATAAKAEAKAAKEAEERRKAAKAYSAEVEGLQARLRASEARGREAAAVAAAELRKEREALAQEKAGQARTSRTPHTTRCMHTTPCMHTSPHTHTAPHTHKAPCIHTTPPLLLLLLLILLTAARRPEGRRCTLLTHPTRAGGQRGAGSAARGGGAGAGSVGQGGAA